MLDLVGNPNCWFSHAQAQIVFEHSRLSFNAAYIVNVKNFV